MRLDDGRPHDKIRFLLIDVGLARALCADRASVLATFTHSLALDIQDVAEAASGGSQAMTRTLALLRTGLDMSRGLSAHHSSLTPLRAAWRAMLRDVMDLQSQAFWMLSLQWCLCTFIQIFLSSSSGLLRTQSDQWLAVREVGLSGYYVTKVVDSLQCGVVLFLPILYLC